VEEEAEIKQQQQQSEDAFAPDAKSRCSRSTPLTKESQKHDTQEVYNTSLDLSKIFWEQPKYCGEKVAPRQ